MVRFFDVLFSLLGLLVLSPLLLVLCMLIALGDGGSPFYSQLRIGRGGVPFRLFKLRSMRRDADSMGLITVGGRDPRITRIGYWIRRYKLDELPQLYNVLRGDMSLVGPRPEVEKYVKLYTAEQRRVLSVRPGITDYASIRYVDENAILGRAEDPEREYVERIMPAKLEYNLIYINNPTLREYFRIILLTARSIVS